MASIKRIQEPIVEPVDLATAKRWLRIDQDSEDLDIADLITSARQQVERDTGRCLITQTWEWNVDALGVDTFKYGRGIPASWQSDAMPPEKVLEFWDRWYGFSGSRVTFPVRPVQSVQSITYRYGGEDVPYTLVPRVAGEADIVFPVGSIPPVSDELYDAVTLTVVCGYGDSVWDAPSWARTLIRMLVAHTYENRQPVAEGGGRSMAVELPLTYTHTVEKYRVMSL